MATSITPPDAVVTIGIAGLGALIQNNAISESHTVAANTEAYGNTINVGIAAEVLLLDKVMIGTAGILIFDGVFIINKDDTNFVRIRFADLGAHTYDIKLSAGQFHIAWNTEINVSATEGAFAAWTQIDQILAQADTGPCDVQIVAFRI